MTSKKKADIEEPENLEPEIHTESASGSVHAQDDSEETIVSIEKKLIALYNLQQIDSQIDRIRIVRGELPLEVEDLEDEVIGLETRITNFESDVETLDRQIAEKDAMIKESKSLIEKYQAQQMNVRNNREFESLNKEIEYQGLEIQLAEKHIKEFSTSLVLKKEEIDKARQELEERRGDLEVKKNELADIVSETEKEEEQLLIKSKNNQKVIEERLLNAYTRIRENARNGLAVVMVERDACGGCFSKIPPQRQLDIKMHKKIIVCEYCGRILVDPAIVEAAQTA
jgi:predicted  nucleic acid-binding Zn-ribbon protein